MIKGYHHIKSKGGLEFMETFYKVNGKLYATKEEAEKAELALEEAKAKEAKLSEERKARAKEIDDARAAVIEAEKHYKELVNAFVRDYKSYHFSYTSTDSDIFGDLFDSFFRLF